MLYLYGDQEPKLSVDGDSSLEETDDYWDASNLYLEHSVAANNEPILSSSKGNDAYTTSSGNFEFWASASDVDGDSFNVFAQVIPPSSSPLKATTIALNTYDAVLDRYTATTDFSTVGGLYVVSYYASFGFKGGHLADEECVCHGDR